MAILFSVTLYALAGITAAAWLVAGARLARDPASLGLAVLFWPAFLPVCLASTRHEPEQPPGDPALDALRERLAQLPITSARKAEHESTLTRLSEGLARRRRELARLKAALHRVAELATTLEARDQRFVEQERARIVASTARLEAELERARESLVKLTLRLELFELRAQHDPLDQELGALEAELGRLLDAQAELEQLA